MNIEALAVELEVSSNQILEICRACWPNRELLGAGNQPLDDTAETIIRYIVSLQAE